MGKFTVTPVVFDLVLWTGSNLAEATAPFESAGWRTLRLSSDPDQVILAPPGDGVTLVNLDDHVGRWIGPNPRPSSSADLLISVIDDNADGVPDGFVAVD